MADLVERLRARAEFEDARVLEEVMRDGFEPVAYTGSESGRMLREAAAALEAAREEVERLAEALRNLHATVKGEAPGLLDEDSGGSVHLAFQIEAALRDHEQEAGNG